MEFPRQEYWSEFLNTSWPIRKNEIIPIAAIWMDLESIIVSEVSQSEKDEFHMTYCLFVESLKNEPISKTEIEWQR